LTEVSRLEVGLVGAEGMLGVSLLVGVNDAPLRALVQGAGAALRVEAAEFSCALKRSPVLREALMRYLYVPMGQLRCWPRVRVFMSSRHGLRAGS